MTTTAFRTCHSRFYICHNAYAGAATAYAEENAALRLDSAAFVVIDEGGAVFLGVELPPSFDGLQVGVVTGADLPRVRSSMPTSRSATAHP